MAGSRTLHLICESERRLAPADFSAQSRCANRHGHRFFRSGFPKEASCNKKMPKCRYQQMRPRLA
jgi:hypothetical protein